MSTELVERLREACNGHPHAKIAWPHRVLHEAADRIEALEQAVDAFADICDELGCERDNEAGLQAATALTAKVAEAEQRIAALMSERSSLIATKAEQLAALTKRATAAEAKVALLATWWW